MKEKMCSLVKPQVEALVEVLSKHLPPQLKSMGGASKQDIELLKDFATFPADDMQQLIANATAFGDKRLAQQASFLSLMGKLLPAMVRLDAVYRGAKSREDRRISKDIANDVSTIRCNMALLATLTMDGQFKPFGGPGHSMQGEMMSEYATLLNNACSLDAQLVLSDMKCLLESSRSACQTDLAQLVAILASWVPAGWEVHKPDLLANMDVCTSLVMNVNYTRLHEGNDMLSKMFACVQQVARDGAGSFLDAGTMKDVKTTIAMVSSTVAHTFSLMMVLSVTPGLEAPAARKKKATELKKQLEEKRLTLCAPLLDRLAALEGGEAFEKFDFEGRAKKMAAQKAALVVAAEPEQAQAAQDRTAPVAAASSSSTSNVSGA